MAVAGWFLCRNPGLNQGPLDLQSNALPTELFRRPAEGSNEATGSLDTVAFCLLRKVKFKFR